MGDKLVINWRDPDIDNDLLREEYAFCMLYNQYNMVNKYIMPKYEHWKEITGQILESLPDEIEYEMRLTLCFWELMDGEYLDYKMRGHGDSSEQEEENKETWKNVVSVTIKETLQEKIASSCCVEITDDGLVSITQSWPKEYEPELEDQEDETHESDSDYESHSESELADDDN